MWYNNFIDPHSGLLGSVDRFTYHCGCEVIKGEKWIANNWRTAPTNTQGTLKVCLTLDLTENYYFMRIVVA